MGQYIQSAKKKKKKSNKYQKRKGGGSKSEGDMMVTQEDPGLTSSHESTKSMATYETTSSNKNLKNG